VAEKIAQSDLDNPAGVSWTTEGVKIQLNRYEGIIRQYAQEEARRLFEHPNADTGNQRYLDDLLTAADFLKAASKLNGFGEYAHGVALELEQLYTRAIKAIGKS